MRVWLQTKHRAEQVNENKLVKKKRERRMQVSFYATYH